MRIVKLLPELLVRARKSRFWLWLLNFALALAIPFTRRHGFKVMEIGDDFIRTLGPYRRANQNHLHSLHACAIATVAEMSAGFLLLSQLDPSRYRLIMAKMKVEYLYQAKQPIVSHSALSPERLENEVLKPLQDQEAVILTLHSRVRDLRGNEIANIHTTWQIKQWDRVRTKP